MLPSSLLAPADASPLVGRAALRLSLPRASWDAADPVTQQDALDASWGAITAEPGYNLGCATGDEPVRLACVMQALVMLDASADGSAPTRSRLQAQGVTSVTLGRGLSETYNGKGSACLNPKVKQSLAPYRGVIVR
jgi:hypothetical protein